MKKIVIIGTVVIVGVVLLVVLRLREQPQGTEDKPTSSQSIDVPSPRIDSPESALRLATAFLDKQKIDLSPWDMSKAATVQMMEFQGSPAWRVEWKLNNTRSSGGTVTKGGELLVLVTDEGQCQLARGK
jgi:hypothetical protein